MFFKKKIKTPTYDFYELDFLRATMMRNAPLAGWFMDSINHEMKERIELGLPAYTTLLVKYPIGGTNPVLEIITAFGPLRVVHSPGAKELMKLS